MLPRYSRPWYTRPGVPTYSDDELKYLIAGLMLTCVSRSIHIDGQTALMKMVMLNRGIKNVEKKTKITIFNKTLTDQNGMKRDSKGFQSPMVNTTKPAYTILVT